MFLPSRRKFLGVSARGLAAIPLLGCQTHKAPGQLLHSESPSEETEISPVEDEALAKAETTEVDPAAERDEEPVAESESVLNDEKGNESASLQNAPSSAGSLTPKVIPPALRELPDGAFPVNESDPVARALGYTHDAATVDVKKWPRRGTPSGQKEFCYNCNFYTTMNENWGKCTLLPKGLVTRDGWCNSWVAKPSRATTG